MSLWWQAFRAGDQPSGIAGDCPGFGTEKLASWEIPESCVNWDSGAGCPPISGPTLRMKPVSVPGSTYSQGHRCRAWPGCRLDVSPDHSRAGDGLAESDVSPPTRPHSGPVTLRPVTAEAPEQSGAHGEASPAPLPPLGRALAQPRAIVNLLLSLSLSAAPGALEPSEGRMGGCQWQSPEAPSAGHLMAEECGQRPVHPSPACLAGRRWPGAGPAGNPRLLPGGGAPGGLPTRVGQSPGATLGPRSSGVTAQSPPSCPSLPDAEHLCCGLPASKGPEESPRGSHTSSELHPRKPGFCDHDKDTSSHATGCYHGAKGSHST